MAIIKKRDNYVGLFIAGTILMIFIILAATNFGVANISFQDTSKIILSKLPFIGKCISLTGINETSSIIVLQLRLPRILLGAMVGAGLSVVGTSFQGIFKNPMADPFVLGISSGAALGATISIVYGDKINFGGMSLTTLSAFGGAILTTLLVYNIARVGSKLQSVTLLLAGVAISYLLSALISLLMLFHRESIEKIVMWTMGNLSNAGWEQVLLLACLIIPCTIIIWCYSRDLNLLLLGDESARSLGVEVDKVKKLVLLVSTIMVAGVVSFSGIIGFVGLIIPHIVRMLFGSNHKVVLPFSSIIGASFMIICDTVARASVPPAEIPVGIITSLLGVPFFLYLLYKTKKKV